MLRNQNLQRRNADKITCTAIILTIIVHNMVVMSLWTEASHANASVNGTIMVLYYTYHHSL